MTASPGRDERDMYHYYQGRDEREDSADDIEQWLHEWIEQGPAAAMFPKVLELIQEQRAELARLREVEAFYLAGGER